MVEGLGPAGATYYHHIWWSYMMIINDDHIWWSYMIIIRDDHLWWSYMIILYDAQTAEFKKYSFSSSNKEFTLITFPMGIPKSTFLELEGFFWEEQFAFLSHMWQVIFQGLCYAKIISKWYVCVCVLKDIGPWMGSPWEMVSSYFGEWELWSRSCIWRY